jgi:release factor glutamine methyltransferase
VWDSRFEVCPRPEREGIEKMPSVRDACLSGFFRGYYRYTAFLNRVTPNPRINGRPFAVAPSVCKPLGNEHVVADYIPPGKQVLEIGCGSGIITLYAALKSKHVTAVDISPDAVDNTKLNMATQGINNVDVILGDAFESVTGTFEVVLSNPPWVNFELDDLNRKWASSATLITQLFRESGRFLKDGGLLVISCPAAAEETLVRLAEENGLELEMTYPREKRKDLRIRLLTLLYLQVGFHPLVYVFRKRQVAA